MTTVTTGRSPDPIVSAGIQSGGVVEPVRSPKDDAKANECEHGYDADGDFDALRLVPWSSLRGKGNEETISLLGPSRRTKKSKWS